MINVLKCILYSLDKLEHQAESIANDAAIIYVGTKRFDEIIFNFEMIGSN